MTDVPSTIKTKRKNKVFLDVECPSLALAYHTRLDRAKTHPDELSELFEMFWLNLENIIQVFCHCWVCEHLVLKVGVWHLVIHG